jgi:hypothetical protein
MKNNIKDEINIEEVLIEASGYNLRNEVNVIAKRHIKNGINKTNAYNLAFNSCIKQY